MEVIQIWQSYIEDMDCTIELKGEFDVEAQILDFHEWDFADVFLSDNHKAKIEQYIFSNYPDLEGLPNLEYKSTIGGERLRPVRYGSYSI